MRIGEIAEPHRRSSEKNAAMRFGGHVSYVNTASRNPITNACWLNKGTVAPFANQQTKDDLPAGQNGTSITTTKRALLADFSVTAVTSQWANLKNWLSASVPTPFWHTSSVEF